jgi:hypothetical protein
MFQWKLMPPTNWGTTPILLPQVVDCKKIFNKKRRERYFLGIYHERHDFREFERPGGGPMARLAHLGAGPDTGRQRTRGSWGGRRGCRVLAGRWCRIGVGSWAVSRSEWNPELPWGTNIPTETRLRPFGFPAPGDPGHNRVAVENGWVTMTQGSPEGFRGNLWGGIPLGFISHLIGVGGEGKERILRGQKARKVIILSGLAH